MQPDQSPAGSEHVGHPHIVGFTGQFIGKVADARGKSFEEAMADVGKTNPTGRIGDPAEFGDACAFLCAASSGFIVGQNLVLDGGSFNSSMG